MLQRPSNPSLQASSLGRYGSGAGKRKESLQLCLWNLNSVSNSPSNSPFQFPFQLARSGNERECKQTLTQHVLRVMTSLLMSSPPISILHWLFQCRYSNSKDVVASSFSFSCPAARAPRRACSQAIKPWPCRKTKFAHICYPVKDRRLYFLTLTSFVLRTELRTFSQSSIFR